VEFLELAKVLDQIENTTKRLEMVDIIANFLKVADEDIMETVFLLQGKVAPDYEGVELGVAEKLVVRALATISGVAEGKIEGLLLKVGDLGKVGEELLKEKKQHSLFSENLTIKKVYNSYSKMARESGSGSQTRKIQILQELLHNSSPVEARFVIRIAIGKMRIGVADMTLVDAIAIAFGSKEDQDEVERAFNIMPNLPEIARMAYNGGIQSLAGVKVVPGVPVRSMLAERLPSLRDILLKMGGVCALEYKYDGLRIQAHKDGNKVTLFSRRLENVTSQFPDIVKEIREKVKAENAILDGEAVPYNIETDEMLPFQEISRRRGRKFDLLETAEKIPVVLFLFDCIYLKGENLMNLPYPQRRLKMVNSVDESAGLKIGKSLIVSEEDDAERFFNLALEAGCEGVVAKSISDKSFYRAGAREFVWIKYKRDYQMEMEDTVDLVVVGAFGGKGRRSGGYGALLMAVYSKTEDKFTTICKLGSGFTDDQLHSLPRMLQRFSLKTKDRRVDSLMTPDYWFEPGLVLEVKGSEITLSPIHTCCRDLIKKDSGLAIRFPRFTGRWREDKKPEETTDEEEILEIYHSQKKKVLAENP
jgi:DNA ligase-1